MIPSFVNRRTVLDNKKGYDVSDYVAQSNKAMNSFLVSPACSIIYSGLSVLIGSCRGTVTLCFLS
jgi:hypothetical protein